MTKTTAEIGKALLDCFANLPDLDEALEAIETALLDQADRLEADEPHATRSIRSLRDAAGRVRDLTGTAEEAVEAAYQAKAAAEAAPRDTSERAAFQGSYLDGRHPK